MKRICIDPGHGGSDPGAIDGIDRLEDDEIYEDKLYTEESKLNHAIARKIYDIAINCEYDAILTRQENEFISLGERCRIANDYNADIFVSIHHNAAANNQARGTEVLYYPASLNGQKLADCIQSRIISRLRLIDRGIKKRDNLYVLKGTDMPAALVEVGFITNVVEEKLLNQNGFQLLVAEQIVSGIDDYFDSIEG